MSDDIAAVVLAAGAGTRLRPLTEILPKALCPVGNVPLVDLAIERARTVVDDVAVNVHHGRDLLVEHLNGRVHISVEAPGPLGTAGALVRLRPWIAGRDVLAINADAWNRGSLSALSRDWDRKVIRMLIASGGERRDFGRGRQAGATLMSWSEVAALPDDAFGLYEASWNQAHEAGRIEFVETAAQFVDCGTPADYHAANMMSSNGDNVVGEGAVVAGKIERTVVWPGAHVRPGEHLADAIRATDDLTVYVR